MRWPWSPRVEPAPPAASDGLVLLRFLRKYCPARTGAQFNVGEVGGFRPALAAELIRQGFARPVKPGARSHPRPALPAAPAPVPPAPDPLGDEIRAAVRQHGWWTPDGDLE